MTQKRVCDHCGSEVPKTPWTIKDLSEVFCSSGCMSLWWADCHRVPADLIRKKFRYLPEAITVDSPEAYIYELRIGGFAVYVAITKDPRSAYREGRRAYRTFGDLSLVILEEVVIAGSYRKLLEWRTRRLGLNPH